MIERVYEQTSKSTLVSKVLVATDHEDIVRTVEKFGGNVVMTSPNCQSGTDRCAEVVLNLEMEEDIIINIQGDEPFIHPEQIEVLIELMQKATTEIGTLAKRIDSSETLFNPNVVKLVKSKAGKALYFSRNPIPYIRGAEPRHWIEKGNFLKHIGMYGYQKQVLIDLAKLPVGILEQAENLEQLRWLEAGYEIYAAVTDFESLGIDTPDDLVRAELLLVAQANQG
jgi:3-deoxy-manno-octulosonate cytidylyltransferase (CMP-KDO synthetase)